MSTPFLPGSDFKIRVEHKSKDARGRGWGERTVPSKPVLSTGYLTRTPKKRKRRKEKTVETVSVGSHLVFTTDL